MGKPWYTKHPQRSPTQALLALLLLATLTLLMHPVQPSGATAPNRDPASPPATPLTQPTAPVLGPNQPNDKREQQQEQQRETAREEHQQQSDHQQKDGEAVRVVRVLRHGARTPSSVEVRTEWPLHRPDTLGVLTSAGKLSSFVLGLQTRREYHALLVGGIRRRDAQNRDRLLHQGIHGQEEINSETTLRLIRKIAMQPLRRWIMRSSSRKRAIESADYFLRGFFGYRHGVKRQDVELFLKQMKQSGQDVIFDPESIKGLMTENLKKKPKKPFLILIPDRSQDPLLKSHHVEVCKYGKCKAEEHAAKFIENFLNKDNKRTFNKATVALSRAWNITGPITPRIMKKVSDICISHGYHHPDNPFCGKYPELATYLEKTGSVVHSSYYTDNSFLKVSLHNLLGYLSMHLSPSSKSPDFVFISTHESTLTPLLRLLNYTGWDKPLLYSASITFEVYVSHVKVYYNRELLDICPSVPAVSRHNQGCTHLQFAEILRKGMFPSDESFKQHCDVPLPTKDLRRLVDKLTGKWQLPLVILCVVVTTLAFKVVQAKKTAVLVQKPKAA